MAIIVSLLGSGSIGYGQSDDFNSGNDNGWTRFGLDSAGLPPATFGFPTDGFGGRAYQLLVSAPAVPDAGPARAFAYRRDVVYTNFYVAVDVIAWDNTVNQAFGFLVRAGNIGLGQTTGYVMNYDPNQASGGRGQFQINSVTAEAPATIATANITLDPNRRYRFVMTGVGSTLTGRVYDLTDLTAPLVTITADDSTYPSGYLGLFNFSRVNAPQYTDPVAGKADTTFDNYSAAMTGPTLVANPGTPASVPQAPEVVNRSPRSWQNFFPATNGLHFTATTFSTNEINTNTIRVVLNKSDVSTGLTITGSPTNLNVGFDGLSSNTVYDAQIVLANSTGWTTTNQCTFDTFSEIYLGSTAVKVIEAEDYNYESGKFQDNPPVSGFNSAGVQVRGSGVGYFDLVGTPGVDYSDQSTQVGSGLPAEYRRSDFVGTGQGALGTGRTAEIDGVNANDTQRQKYAADDVAEYEVRRTEVGEWLNYTRNFVPGKYNAYLRVACRIPQDVRLDRVLGDPTTTNQTTASLGPFFPFFVPSTTMAVRYRYVAMLDTDWNLAVLDLSGTQTLRLTIGCCPMDATQYTMYINYLLFVPIPPTLPEFTLQSSAKVNGLYAVENGASVDRSTRTIRAVRSGNRRFYRISWNVEISINQVRITKVSIIGQNVVINYEICEICPRVWN